LNYDSGTPNFIATPFHYKYLTHIAYARVQVPVALHIFTAEAKVLLLA